MRYNKSEVVLLYANLLYKIAKEITTFFACVANFFVIQLLNR